MSNPTLKKLEIQIPFEIYKAAKLKANQEGKSVQEWIALLVQKAMQPEEQQVISALDWGRIDSRIDQRTARLEHEVEKLAKQIEHLSKEQRFQQSLSDYAELSSVSIR